MKILSTFILVSAVYLAPFATQAATLSIEAPVVPVDTEVAIPVFFSPDGAQINVVEGTINVPNELHVTRISTGGSALSLWTVPAAYSREDGTITFTGGVPRNSLPQEKSLIFTVYARALEPGTYTLSPKVTHAYLADGTGTQVAVAATPTELTVGGDVQVPAPDVEDKAKPQVLVAELGSDPALFDGFPFVSFYGSDAETGVASYEAREGWFGTYENVDRYYVLKNADAHAPVWIRAHDVAGNVKTVHVPGTGGVLYQAYVYAPVLVLLLLGYLIWRRIPKR